MIYTFGEIKSYMINLINRFLDHITDMWAFYLYISFIVYMGYLFWPLLFVGLISLIPLLPYILFFIVLYLCCI